MDGVKKLRVGLIGSGRMAGLYGRIIQQSPLAAVVAVVGNTPAKTEQLAQSLGCRALPHQDYAALWALAPDAVVIATPEWAHVQPTLQALAQNTHILLEKPLTDNLADAQQIGGAALGYEKTLMLCHVLRFDPRFALLRQAVHKGDFGAVRHVYMRRSTDYQTYQRIAGKFHPAFWLTPHDVDLLRWITGAEVEQVQAHLAPDDGLWVDFWLSNGALARLENSWASAPLAPLWRMEQFDLTGTQGRADLLPAQNGMQFYTADGGVSVPDTVYQPEVHGQVRGLFAELIQHFLAVCLGKQAPVMTFADGLHTMYVADAIQRAAETGQRVRVEL